jgi:hypothetical protein
MNTFIYCVFKVNLTLYLTKQHSIRVMGEWRRHNSMYSELVTPWSVHFTSRSIKSCVFFRFLDKFCSLVHATYPAHLIFSYLVDETSVELHINLKTWFNLWHFLRCGGASSIESVPNNLGNQIAQFSVQQNASYCFQMFYITVSC